MRTLEPFACNKCGRNGVVRLLAAEGRRIVLSDAGEINDVISATMVAPGNAKMIDIPLGMSLPMCDRCGKIYCFPYELLLLGELVSKQSQPILKEGFVQEQTLLEKHLEEMCKNYKAVASFPKASCEAAVQARNYLCKTLVPQLREVYGSNLVTSEVSKVFNGVFNLVNKSIKDAELANLWAYLTDGDINISGWRRSDQVQYLMELESLCFRMMEQTHP